MGFLPEQARAEVPVLLTRIVVRGVAAAEGQAALRLGRMARGA